MRTSIKRYNGTIDAQSSIDAMLRLRREYDFGVANVASIDVDIFQLAFDVIGGGEEGDKYTVHTKEQADHSLRYMIACACLDRQLMPEQYAAERFLRTDVQALPKKVRIRPSADYTARFPQECCVRIAVRLDDGRAFTVENTAYDGYYSRPMSWDSVIQKFDRLTESRVDAGRRRQMIEVVHDLERHTVRELVELI